MPEYDYLIVGGGMAADAAAKGIRGVAATASIGMICGENHPPYNRPPLSKGLWKGDSIDKVWRSPPAPKIDLHLSRTARRLDPAKRTVVDDAGTAYTYRKLLLATGGKVRTLPFDVEGIIYFRTLDDYHRLRAGAGPGKRVIVIGGGFIGSEVAAALAMNGVSVTMVFPEDGIGARVYPPPLSGFLNGLYRSKGVELLARDGVAGIARRGEAYIVTTTGGRELGADGVVAGIGIQPDVDLARAAGLAVENGIVVDEFLRTSDPDIYAAGDVANFQSQALGKRTRVEHEDNANVMGERAGKNMAGDEAAYRHLPFFYSDMFEAGYEAVGELDARHEVVEDWKKQFEEGVLYYLDAGRVRGVLLWNTWGQVEAARALIGEPGPFTSENVRGRLPV